MNDSTETPVPSALPRRTWYYALPPSAFELSPHSCGKVATQWSEFERHVWCDACQVDFIPEHNGVFDGPIPLKTAAMMGLVFDRVLLPSLTIDRFDIDRMRYESEMMDPQFTQDDVDRARAFALERHAGQMYGTHDYGFHLQAVAALARPYGFFAEILGWLHDVQEDGHATAEEMRRVFGAWIADGVELLSDLPGATRKERKAATYARLAQVVGPLQAALIAKAADRLANWSQSVADGNERLIDIYRGEHPAFSGAAYRPGLCDDLWRRLDALFAQ